MRNTIQPQLRATESGLLIASGTGNVPPSNHSFTALMDDPEDQSYDLFAPFDYEAYLIREGLSCN